ncbi:MAG: 1-acyl-sn-glycerol-3-phosphate acyltransferase [Firmicutes bacterium]|nr:1-acyl-sn-glycerol-3-phosphate acyltransferase [Bacillota bacterium]
MAKQKKAPNLMFKILRGIMKPMLKRKYGVEVDRSMHKTLKRPCFILCNHQAAFDQFVMGLAFKFGINIVASDAIFRHGFQSWLMKKLVRPIPITKGQSDVQAVKKMMQTVKIGGTVGIFPEGNRCFFGETMTIGQGTGRLAKMLKVPLILMRMEGGYFAKPRWKIQPNKGIVKAGVVKILSVEELEGMTNEEVQKTIEENLYQNDFEFNKDAKIKFLGKARAEHLESILFYCPKCHALDCMHSKIHDFYCTKCDLKTGIDEYGFFYDGDSVPQTILDWSKLQLEFIKTIDYSPYNDKPIFFNDDIILSKAIKAKKQTDAQKGDIKLYNDRFEFCDTTIYLKDIKNLSIQEVRKLQIYTNTDIFVVDAKLKTNLVKYMIVGYHLKNVSEGKKDEYFGY